MSAVSLSTATAQQRLMEFQAFLERLLANKALSRAQVAEALADHFTKASRRDREIWAEVLIYRVAGISFTAGA